MELLHCNTGSALQTQGVWLADVQEEPSAKPVCVFEELAPTRSTALHLVHKNARTLELSQLMCVWSKLASKRHTAVSDL